MPKRHQRGRSVYPRWLTTLVQLVQTWATAGTRWGWRSLHHLRRPTFPIEVLLTDPIRRRALECHLRDALNQLERTISAPFPGAVAVVVQQVIATDRQIAGCCQIVQGPGGGRIALLRLALQVNGKPFGPDELLAVLAEQYLGLATQMSGSTSILVPVDLEMTPSPPRHEGMPPDPLTSHRNGAAPMAPTRGQAA